VKSLSIKLKAIAPLSIRSDRAPDGAKVAGYIPGTTFMGCLASVHRRFYPEKRHEFEQLFLREQVHYSSLYPAIFHDRGMQDSDLPVYPVPKTAQSCKRYDGFLYPKNDENEAHGVRDSLLDWALFKISSGTIYKNTGGEPLAALREHKNCSCSEAMDHFAGYYRRQADEPYNMIAANVCTRLQTHTGIDRESGIIQDGILYNRQVFENDMRFFGTVRIFADEEITDHFKEFIEESGHTGLIHIGTGRTRGMGKVTLNVEEEDVQSDPFALFTKRLYALDDLVHKQAEVFNLSGLQHTFFFSLTLHSPLILCDDLLRYRTSIDTHMLTGLLGCQVPGLQCIYQIASVRRVTGWQELWGMPRMNEYAIDTGSVFLFACASPPGEEVLQALFKLEEHSVGKRCTEGFGRVCVSDRFHQEITLR
jgi:CRISPR-associated protein Csx10